MVTEGVVHSVYNVVTWLCFGVIWQHKVNGDNGGCLLVIHVYTTLILLPSYCYLWLHTMSNHWACVSYLMDTPNLGRYEASWEVVLPPSN